MRYNVYVITISRAIITTRPFINYGIAKNSSIRLTRLDHQSQRRFMSSATMERTYEAALARLASLQSNQAITSLFSSTPAPTRAPASTTGTNSKTEDEDLNALAIPEMLTWARRGGIDPQKLADGDKGLRCIHVSGTKGKGSVCAFLTSILTETEQANTNTNTNTDTTGRTGAGRVGTYTSPHLVSVRERILLDGVPISRDAFARYFFEVWDTFTEAGRAELVASSSSSTSSSSTSTSTSTALPAGLTEQEKEDLLQGPATKPFYFRFLTILAFHVFLREGVRSAVVECGIGAEYDPTNAMLLSSPAGPKKAVTVSVVAQLGVDHVAMLGATVPEIAWHKAGVCKEGTRCFTRKLDGGVGRGEGEVEGEETMRVLRRRAVEKGAELVEVDDDAVAAWGGVRGGDETSLGGAFQVFNQALAVCAAREHLRVLQEEEEDKKKKKKGRSSSSSVSEQRKPLAGPKTSEEWLSNLPPGFVEGLKKAKLRGRCETVVDGGGVTWLIDGAHTAESLDEVARWFVAKQQKQGQKKQKRVLIFNQQERDAAKMLRRLVGSIEQFSGGVSGAGMFNLAIFTRNDMLPRKTDESDNEPERDLSVQRAAADAMREIPPKMERGGVLVVDSVGEAVGRVRGLDDEEKEDVVVLVTGSLHLVGAVLRTLEPDGEM